MRSTSGMLVAPERRMSSCVMTVTAAADWPMVLSLLETEMTSTSISSSKLIFLNAVGFSPTCAARSACSDGAVVACCRSSQRPSTARETRNIAQIHFMALSRARRDVSHRLERDAAHHLIQIRALLFAVVPNRGILRRLESLCCQFRMLLEQRHEFADRPLQRIRQ